MEVLLVGENGKSCSISITSETFPKLKEALKQFRKDEVGGFYSHACDIIADGKKVNAIRLCWECEKIFTIPLESSDKNTTFCDLNCRSRFNARVHSERRKSAQEMSRDESDTGPEAR